MAAPKKANVGPAAEARRQIGLETAAVKLRAAGRDNIDPPAPARHYHRDGFRCWTPTLCAGLEAADNLRAFAAERGDAELLALVERIAESLPAYPHTVALDNGHPGRAAFLQAFADRARNYI